MNECELIFPKAEALVCTERGTLSRLAPLAPGHMGGQVSRAVFTQSQLTACASRWPPSVLARLRSARSCDMKCDPMTMSGCQAGAGPIKSSFCMLSDPHESLVCSYVCWRQILALSIKSMIFLFKN